MNGAHLTLGLTGALVAASFVRRGSAARERVTLGKTSGPSDSRASDVLLDGEVIGELVSSKQVVFRPARHVDFAAVDVTLWEPYDYEASFTAKKYGDAATARKAALTSIREFFQHQGDQA